MSAAPKQLSPIIATSGWSAVQILNSILCDGVRHVCQLDGHEHEKERKAAELCEKDPRAFFLNPASSILGSEDLLYSIKFSSSVDKNKIIKGIESTLAVAGLPGSLRSEVQLVADELFTNAVYNAPVVDLSTHVNPGIARDSNVVAMHAGKSGNIFIAQDQSRLVVGCSDPYGSLDIVTYLKKILATCELGADSTINFGAGGAGLGSYIIFNSGSSLFIGVAPGQSTVICSVFPLKMSGKNRAALPKHLHCVQY